MRSLGEPTPAPPKLTARNPQFHKGKVSQMNANSTIDTTASQTKGAVRDTADTLKSGTTAAASSTAETARDKADAAVDAASSTVQGIKDKAAGAAETVKTTVQDRADAVRERTAEVADTVKSEADRLYRQGERRISDAAQRAGECYEDLSEMTHRQPAAALGVAAGVGFLVGLVLSSRR